MEKHDVARRVRVITFLSRGPPTLGGRPPFLQDERHLPQGPCPLLQGRRAGKGWTVLLAFPCSRDLSAQNVQNAKAPYFGEAGSEPHQTYQNSGVLVHAL